MLSFLRKHQYGFMLVVAIIVIIAFTFFYDTNDRSGNPRTQKVFTIYGKDYNQADLQQFGSTLQLAQRLGLYEMITALYGERLDGSPQEFIYNLIILREEAGKLGVRASQQDIEAKIRQMPAFSPAGSFDQATFDNVKANLGSFGFTTEDLYALIGDDIALGRLRELLTGSFVPTTLEIDDAFAKQFAKVSAYRLDFPAEKFAGDIEVADAEIAEYFEANQTTLLSQTKRSIEFVHFTQPDFTTPATLTSPVAPETTPETAPESTPETAPETAPEENSSSCQGGTDEAGTPLGTTDADGAVAPESAPTEVPPTEPAPLDTPSPDPSLGLDTPATGSNPDALDRSASLLDDPSLVPPPVPSGPTLEERTAAMLEYNRFMDGFITAASAPGADFKTLAEAAAAASADAKHRAEFGSTELFAEDAPPENLKDERTLLRAIFSHPASKPISIPVRVANGFYIFRLTGDEPPRNLSLEEATDRIRETLTKEKQVEAVKKAAAEAREQIMATLKGGATFADAARSAGHEATRIPTFTGGEGPLDVADFATHLREPIAKTAAGQISEPHVVGQSAVLVYVASRVVPEDPENEGRRKEVAGNLVSQQYSRDTYSALIFKAWLEQARARAEPKPDDLGLGKSVF